MPSGRFLLCWGNRHRDLRHVGCWVVADDVIDQGDLARGTGGRQVVIVHVAEQPLVTWSCLPMRATSPMRSRPSVCSLGMSVTGPLLSLKQGRGARPASPRYATSSSKAPRRLSTVNATTQMTADRMDPHGEAMPMGNNVSE